MSIIIYKHEPWADEAQAWLIARDSNVFDLLFKSIRYEGTPGLWYLILMLPSRHLPYYFINIISGLIAVIGIYIFLRYSPFPKIVKILFPFSYFIFYQYAVVARNYVLLPILLFLIAKTYKDKTNKIYLFTLYVCLLANVSAHGFLIAISIMFIHLIDLFKEKRYHLNKKLKIKQIKVYVIFAIIIGLIIIQMWSPKNLSSPANGLNFSISHFLKLSYFVLNGSMTKISFISIFILISSSVWFWRKRLLLLYLVPTLALLSFFSIKYYNSWHQGILFLVFIFVMWISLESKKNRSNLNNKLSKIIKTIVILSLALILLFHISWSFSVSVNDFYGPYSAGKSIADYIKTNQLENKKIYATTFWSTTIQPYFDNNIFDNYNNKQKPAFWLWSTKNNMIQDYETILRDKPDLIIFGRPSKNLREIEDYQFVGIFEGNMYWKRTIKERNNFALFRKEETS
jgi:hypothetical protein